MRSRIVYLLIVTLILGACGLPSGSDGLPAAQEGPARQADEVQLARDLPTHVRGEIPVQGLTDSALRPISASPLPLILPRIVPASHVWTLDARRIFVSSDASGEVIAYTYFLVADGDRAQQIAVDVGTVTKDADGPRLAEYAPTAPDAGMAAGLIAYRLDGMESVRFIFEASDLALTVEIFRDCHREEDWTIGEGICFSWAEVRQIVTTMGMVEP